MAMANPNRVYEDFKPPSALVKEQGDTILIYLPGFRKEQLKVQLTPSRVLKVNGEQPIGDKKWRRFQKEFAVSTNCNTKEITAKFDRGILYIRQPTLITPTPPEQQLKVIQQPKPDHHKPPVEAPPPPTPPTPLPSIPEEEIARKEQAKISDKGKEQVREGQRQQVVAAGIGLFKELRNPDNHKKIAVYVMIMTLVAFYVLQLYKSLRKIGQKTVIEYDKEL